MNQATNLAVRANSVTTTIYIRRTAAISEPLPKLVQRMLEFFDGARSLAEVCTAVQIPEAKALAIVKKLSSLGLITPASAGEALEPPSALETGETLLNLPTCTSSFSPAEEAFFASEVAPAEEEPAPSLTEKLSLFVSDLMLRSL